MKDLNQRLDFLEKDCFLGLVRAFQEPSRACMVNDRYQLSGHCCCCYHAPLYKLSTSATCHFNEEHSTLNNV